MSMNTKRRLFLKGSMAAGAVGAAVGTGLLTPQAVLAEWPEAQFSAKALADTLAALSAEGATDSADITVKAPDIAENGAVVPITVETSMDGVESISIIAAENPTPLVAKFMMGPGAMGFCGTRIKMGATSDVIAVVKTADGLHKASKNVKVTIGGCGG